MQAEDAPTNLALAAFMLAALVNAWRAIAGGPFGPVTHLLLAATFGAVAIAVQLRLPGAWHAAMGLAAADSVIVLSTLDPAMFGSTITPIVSVVLLLTPAARTYLSSE